MFVASAFSDSSEFATSAYMPALPQAVKGRRVASNDNDKKMLELQVLQQIRDSLSSLNSDMRETRERVIRLEERDCRVSSLENLVVTLDARVDVLLKDKDRRDGAMSFGQTLLKHLPSISVGGIIAALAAWFSKAID